VTGTSLSSRVTLDHERRRRHADERQPDRGRIERRRAPKPYRPTRDTRGHPDARDHVPARRAHLYLGGRSRPGQQQPKQQAKHHTNKVVSYPMFQRNLFRRYREAVNHRSVADRRRNAVRFLRDRRLVLASRCERRIVEFQDPARSHPPTL